jgi:hypothetical protein
MSWLSKFFRRGTKYNFPKEIEHLLYDEMRKARGDLAIHGTTVKELAKSLTVSLIPGEVVRGGFWCFRSHNEYRAGSTSGRRHVHIRLAHNPKDKSDVHRDAIRHEMWHYWLLSNGYPEDHSHEVFQ